MTSASGAIPTRPAPVTSRAAAPDVPTDAPGAPEHPAHDCPLCPRLVAYREANRQEHPEWWNGPVPSWGSLDAELLVVGMAPGVRGANRTGRPFTGDFAGTLLYETLLKFGFATGAYGADPSDGMALSNCRIVNAVRCVPPANLPQPVEVRTCNRFLRSELEAIRPLRVVLALGVLAHSAVLAACGIPVSRLRFRHGQILTLPDGLLLADSYHVSRYNTNTGRLTTAMFESVVAELRACLQQPGRDT
ncbi:uracil-DNA glycosylase [Lichenicoccus roseus]|uniref:Type-5 uracil-DNA glycosylase n=1 Tax=Lichenicoccus roseus TaxID=2683649 RepID=A0A5R9J8F9_9PROT|nr:uracil-DNA glycosylase [Lichenicoccus roseus]TLU73872.1 uracil-DNA glycosylase [Lichenicoccus roseus]